MCLHPQIRVYPLTPEMTMDQWKLQCLWCSDYLTYKLAAQLNKAGISEYMYMRVRG